MLTIALFMGAGQDYADNSTKEAVDESSLDLSLAYNLTPRFLTEEELPDAPVRFYCRKCEDFVEVTSVIEQRRRRKKPTEHRRLKCQSCESMEHIQIGTERSLRHHLHLPPAS